MAKGGWPKTDDKTLQPLRVGVKNSDDEPSDPLIKGVENSDDGVPSKKKEAKTHRPQKGSKKPTTTALAAP